MIPAELKVVLDRDRHGNPLVTLANLPGEGAEATPDQLRGLAMALLEAAGEAEARSMGKGFMAVKRQFSTK